MLFRSTIHRAENTDSIERLCAIFEALGVIAREIKVVVPLHPRTRSCLESAGLASLPLASLSLIDPVGYLDMMLLERHAKLIATDSGGVQKEAYFHQVPCVTLRDETEWGELVETGWNRLVPPRNVEHIVSSLRAALKKSAPLQRPGLYGNGRAADEIARLLIPGGR